MVRRILIAATAAVVAALMLVTGAGAAVPPQGKIGPNQVFGGLVNGQSGVNTPAVIRMACFGPIRPGETGHPFRGQTVDVFRPEVIVGNFGYTGANANSIVAFFGPPPPSAAASTVTFKRYSVEKAIPTSLELPCAGTGTVTFVPFPRDPTNSRAATVSVSYEGQP